MAEDNFTAVVLTLNADFSKIFMALVWGQINENEMIEGMGISHAV